MLPLRSPLVSGQDVGSGVSYEGGSYVCQWCETIIVIGGQREGAGVSSRKLDDLWITFMREVRVFVKGVRQNTPNGSCDGGITCDCCRPS